MTQERHNTGQTSAPFWVSSYKEEFSALDQLSSSLRSAIAQASIPFSAVQIKRYLSEGLNEEELIEAMRETAANVHREITEKL